MTRQDEIRLRHMLDAAREAVGFVGVMTREELGLDRRTLLSAIKEIEIIGEAANRVSVATRAEFPQVPWKQIVGMRNRLIHVYFDIDLRVVWDVVRGDLPPLIRQLEAILPDSPRLF